MPKAISFFDFLNFSIMILSSMSRMPSNLLDTMVEWPNSAAGWRGVRATDWSDSGQIYVEASGAMSGSDRFVLGVASGL